MPPISEEEFFSNPSKPLSEEEFFGSSSIKQNPFVATAKSTGAHMLNSFAGQPVEDIGSQLGMPVVQQFGKGVREYAEGVQKANPSSINSVSDAIEHPIDAVQTALGNVLPQVPVSLGSAYAGARAGAGLGGLIGGAPGAAIGGVIGGVGGAFAPNYLQEATEMRSKQHESGQEDMAKAYEYAIPAAGLETASDALMLGKFMPDPVKSGVIGRALSSVMGDTLTTTGSRGIHAIKQGAKAALGEAGTEYLQTGLEQLGGNQDISTEQAAQERNVSALLGGIGGGILGGGISAFDRRQDKTKPANTRRDQPSQGSGFDPEFVDQVNQSVNQQQAESQKPSMTEEEFAKAVSDRERVLKEKAHGTKDTKAVDPVTGKEITVPGKWSQFLRPEEQAELSELDKLRGDTASLAKLYGVDLVKNDAATLLSEQGGNKEEKQKRIKNSLIESSINYDVDTKDSGKFSAKVGRLKNGGVVIFADGFGVIEYNKEFANGKTDDDLLKYSFEPQGYTGSTLNSSTNQEANNGNQEKSAEQDAGRQGQEGLLSQNGDQPGPSSAVTSLSQTQEKENADQNKTSVEINAQQQENSPAQSIQQSQGNVSAEPSKSPEVVNEFVSTDNKPASSNAANAIQPQSDDRSVPVYPDESVTVNDQSTNPTAQETASTKAVGFNPTHTLGDGTPVAFDANENAYIDEAGNGYEPDGYETPIDLQPTGQQAPRVPKADVSQDANTDAVGDSTNAQDSSVSGDQSIHTIRSNRYLETKRNTKAYGLQTRRQFVESAINDGYKPETDIDYDRINKDRQKLSEHDAPAHPFRMNINDAKALREKLKDEENYRTVRVMRKGDSEYGVSKLEHEYAKSIVKPDVPETNFGNMPESQQNQGLVNNPTNNNILSVEQAKANLKKAKTEADIKQAENDLRIARQQAMADFQPGEPVKKPEPKAYLPEEKQAELSNNHSQAYKSGYIAAFDGYSIEPSSNFRSKQDKDDYQKGWLAYKDEQIAKQTPESKSVLGKKKAKINDTDDILTVIAKLGGINSEHAKQEGIDPAHFKTTKHGIKRVFNKNGRSFDEMAEILRGYGFDVPMANDLLDQVSRAVNQGEKIFNAVGAEKFAEKMAQEQYDAEEAEFHFRVGALLDRAKAELDEAGYQSFLASYERGSITPDEIAGFEQDLEDDIDDYQQRAGKRDTDAGVTGAFSEAQQDDFLQPIDGTESASAKPKQTPERTVDLFAESEEEQKALESKQGVANLAAKKDTKRNGNGQADSELFDNPALNGQSDVADLVEERNQSKFSNSQQRSGHSAAELHNRIQEEASEIAPLLGRSVKIISGKQAVADAGEDAKDAQGYVYNGVVYLVHDNIDADTNLKGLVLHEVAVHAMQLGRDDKEFKSILRNVELMLKSGNKAMREAAEMVPENTNPEHRAEEILAYYVQHNPNQTLSQRFMSWFRDMLRKIGVNAKLTPDDLVYMAHKALRSASTSMQLKGGRETGVLFHAAWHGSPHDHDKFDSSKIGTGEGNQAFGYGLYFTDAKHIAEWYRDNLSRLKNDNKEVKKWLKDSDNFYLKSILDMAQKEPKKLNELKEKLQHPKWGIPSNDDLLIDISNAYSVLGSRNDAKSKLLRTYFKEYSVPFPSVKGKLYEVELAPEQDEYLDWDKPLSEQSEKVKDALGLTEEQYQAYQAFESKRQEMVDKYSGAIGNMTEAEKEVYRGLFNEYKSLIKDSNATLNVTGNLFYKRTADRKGSDKAASDYLHSLGIRGIRYKAEQGKSDANNYVVFNDADISIAAKYSKATSAEIKQADAFEKEYGIRPYTSEGQISVPVKFSIKAPYAQKDLDKGKENHPILGIPLNQNGTATLYFPTTNEKAREIARTKKISPDHLSGNRVYLTNESSAGALKANPGNIKQEANGANVLVHVDPSLLQIDTVHPDGRIDFFIPIAEGKAFFDKMKQTKLFTLDKSRNEAISVDRTFKTMEEGITEAIALLKGTNLKERAAAVREAKQVLKEFHNITTLLSENGKLQKTRVGDYGLKYEGESVASMGLGLASAQKLNEKKLSTCLKSAICESLCLGETSGQNLLYGGDGEFRSGPRLSQYLKTEALVLHPKEFAILLSHEISLFENWAAKTSGQESSVDDNGNKIKTPKQVYKPAIRLNVTSDIPPSVYKALIEAHPNVEFYDYTKLPTNSIAPNHHLTYSSTGASQVVNGKLVYNQHSNWNKMVGRLNDGQNVAMAFSDRNEMPKFVVDEKTGQTFSVWDGDQYDARFLDPKREDGKGWIIGLTNKDKKTPINEAVSKHNGFFIHYDPEVDGDTVTIKDQTKLLNASLNGDTKFSKQSTKSKGYSQQQAINQLAKEVPGIVPLLGQQVRVISEESAIMLAGESARGAQGFVVDDTIYFVHDNIDANTDLKGLALHEVAVHAMQLGKDSVEFKAILKQVEAMIVAGNKKMLEAQAMVPSDTKAKHKTEETLAYFVQANPNLPLAKRFMAWFRDALRAIGKTIKPLERVKFMRWANSLTTDDLTYMAQKALKSAPSAMQFKGGRTQGVWFHAAWHGSPHDHDRFDSSKIGTGEGAQAYGYGLYFTDKKDIAEWYRDKLTGFNPNVVAVDGKEFSYIGEGKIGLIDALKDKGVSSLDAVAFVHALQEYKGLEGVVTNYGWVSYDATKDEIAQSDRIMAVVDKVEQVSSKGKLYQVELAPSEDEYLDWTTRLDKQSELVQSKLKDHLIEGDNFDYELKEIATFRGHPVYELRTPKGGAIIQAVNTDASAWRVDGPEGQSPGRFATIDDAIKASKQMWRNPTPDQPTGASIYETLSRKLGSQKVASDYLHSIGIRGIRYQAEGGKSDASNYVIFNDADVSITAKFSKGTPEAKPDKDTQNRFKQKEKAFDEQRLKEQVSASKAGGNGGGRGITPYDGSDSNFDGEPSRDNTLKSRAKGIVDTAHNWFDRMGPLGSLPDRAKYLSARYKTLGNLAKVEEVGKSVYDTFAKATKDDAEAIYRYLTTKGATVDEIHSVDLRESAKDVKKAISEIGKQLVERGFLDQETHDKYEGMYLPRVYLKHVLGDDLFKALGSGKTPSDLGYLKQRKDIPEEVRRLILMEIKDPAYLTSRALNIPMRDIAIFNWFDQIANNKKWVWDKSFINLDYTDPNQPKVVIEEGDGRFKDLVDPDNMGEKGSSDYIKTKQDKRYKVPTFKTINAKQAKNTRKVTPYFLLQEADRMFEQANAAPSEDRADIKALADAYRKLANDVISGMQAEGDPKDFVQMPKSKRYGALAGLVVRKEIHDDIVGTMTLFQGEPSIAQKILGDGGVLAKYTSLWKWPLALDTKIPTPSGWTTMGDIAVGDKVFDENGNVCDVTHVLDVLRDRECFEVLFSDNTKIVADKDHLWMVVNSVRNKSILTTEQIKDTLTTGPRGDKRHSIPVANAIDLPEVELPIPPYALGVWLGDGCSGSARICAGKDDASEIIQNIEFSGLRCGSGTTREDGLIVFPMQKPLDTCIRNHDKKYARENGRGCKQCEKERKRNDLSPIVNESISEKLRSLGVFDDKHIPAIYLRSSKEQRLELLRGLMDTDGWAENNRTVFGTSNSNLRDGVVELLRTLGYKPVVLQTAPVNMATGREGKTAWKIQYQAYSNSPVFHLKRKKDRLRDMPSVRPRSQTRQIVSVEKVDTVPVRCISVSSPSSLFLAGEGFIPTHNCKVAANPPSHIRNFMSNLVLLHLSGVSFHRVPQRIFQAIDEIKNNGQHWKIAKEYGVTKSSFADQEMLRINRELADLLVRNDNANRWEKLKAVVHQQAGRVMDKTGDWYQWLESVSKTAKIIDEMEKGRSAEEAVMAAHEALFDYSLVSPSVRYLRNAPIGMPFATFYIKALPFLAKTMLTHPMRFAPYVVMLQALTMLVAAQNDVDDDDIDKLKKALPEWLQEKGHAYLLPWKDSHGRWQAVDLGFFFPWTIFYEVGKEIGSGEVMDAIKTLGILGSPVADLIAAIQTGEDPFTRKPIINEYGSPSEKAADVLNYLWRMNMPTIITDQGAVGVPGVVDGKIAEAFKGVVNKYGEPKDTVSQALLRSVGVNVYGIDAENQRNINIKRKKYEITEAKAAMTKVLHDKSLTPEQRQSGVNRLREEVKNRQQALRDYMSESTIHPNLL